MHSSHIASLLMLAAPLVSSQAMYSKNSPVLQLDQKSYDKLIAKSNYTSVVEFYAPWCGHCKNLAPAYESAAKTLSGIAKVGAVNCDDDLNKPFCGSMGVQGFPTIKIVKPSKQPGKRGVVEDYAGPRTAKGITDAVTDKIPSYVMRLKTGAEFEKFVTKTPDRPKGLVFSEKGLVPAFVKTLAIDFLGGLDFGYVRSADKELVSRFGVTQFPAVLLLPNGDESEPKRFEGEMKKANLLDFFSQVMPPHPDALPAAADSKSKPKAKPTSSKSASKSKAKPATHPAATESLDKDSYPEHPTPSPNPDASSEEKPVEIPVAKTPASAITHLETPDALQKSCLHAGSSTCLIAVVPGSGRTPVDELDDESAEAQTNPLLAALAAIAHKSSSRGAKLFPMYSVDGGNTEWAALADALNLPTGAVVLAVNAKRGWYALLEGVGRRVDSGEMERSVRDFVDGIRLGDFKKGTLPEGLVKELVEVVEEKKEEEEVKEERVEHVDL